MTAALYRDRSLLARVCRHGIALVTGQEPAAQSAALPFDPQSPTAPATTWARRAPGRLASCSRRVGGKS
jgi:hypothetical protein